MRGGGWLSAVCVDARGDDAERYRRILTTPVRNRSDGRSYKYAGCPQGYEC
eukprot:COSAG03_NODE_21419_length_304_cov_0.946341_1_plen_50_part_10